MKRILLIFATVMILVPLVHAQQYDPCGSWLGRLSAGGVWIRIVFNISTDDADNLKTTMDSPDQGAKGIPMEETILTTDTLIIKAPVMRGEYRGVMVNDTSIEGTWTQSGLDYQLNLYRQQEEFKLNRPQEPQPPFPYAVERIKFPSLKGDFELGGTLTLPGEGGPFPAVILVSGSGSQNRDEEIFGHKPFFVLADHLTRGGIAVLRYDDRGVAESGGDPAGATSGDLAGDARAAVDYLCTRREIDKEKIGVIGHSEGGLIGLMLAAEYDDIAFLVSLAGPGVIGRTILEDQTEYISRLGGLPEDVLEQSMQVNRKIYSIMEEYEDPQRGIDSIYAFVTRFYGGQGMEEEIIDQVTDNIRKSINPGSYPWLRYFIKSDPGSYFADIKCPVLVLNGEKDCQVMAEKNVDALVSGLSDAGNDDVTGKIFPDLNHLFQTSGSGLPDEYGEIEETMNPEVLDLILRWIRERVK